MSGGKRCSLLSKSQGVLLGSSPLKSDGSCGSQAWRLNHIYSGQRHSNESRKTTLGSQGT
jgi:hypothetical protein